MEIILTHIFYIVLFAGLWFYIKRIYSRKFDEYKKRIEKYFNEQTEEIQEQNSILQRKNKKNEELLANMLPQETANEIKSHGKATSHRFKLVTVLFADIQGFTKIAEQMNPEMLIDELDKIFFHFDSIAEKYNIEKIKTIGDAYMCAGGIPVKNKTNPIEVVLAALEMQNYLKELHKNTETHYSKIWNLRIGIHTGPVIAGVVGKKKFSYDIWGDSVNVASRMESSGDTGKVNVSSTTHRHTVDFFEFEFRGRMPVKYKGEIEMYFVKGIKTDLSEFKKNVIPNKIFKAKMAIVRLEDIYETVFDKLAKDLPYNCYYHNYQNAIDFVNRVELIGLGEYINDIEMLLLKTAAVFFYTGLTKSYTNFIDESINTIKEMLPSYSYSDKQIETICSITGSIKKVLNPQSKLESIFCDAYLDYLGSFDFIPILRIMYKEKQENKQFDNLENWYKSQLKLLKNHNFNTYTAIMLRDVEKSEQIAKLKKALK